MPTLHISVQNKVATYRQRDGGIVCGNSDYEIAFSFDDEWDAYPHKVARFIWNSEFFDVRIEGDTCVVPVIQNASEVKVGVFADELSTTTPATISCLGSILCASTNTKPSTENDEYWANDARESAEVASEAATRSEDAAERAVAIAGFEAREFYEHRDRTDNPHGVTVEQIGAVPVTRTVNGKPLSGDVTLRASDVGAVPVERTVNEKPLSSNVALTASDVGAAPAGFGLGDNAVPSEALDGIRKTGFYYAPLDGAICLVIHENLNDSHAVQTAVSVANVNVRCKKIRCKTGGVWSEWEYVNPPMQVGVEYRTTERWQGKPVYTRLFRFGSFTLAKRVELSAGNFVIRLAGLYEKNGVYNIRSKTGYSYPLDNGGTGLEIAIDDDDDAPCTDAWIQAWYVKG